MKHRMNIRIVSMLMVFVMLLSYIPVVGAVDASTDIKAIEKPKGISIVEAYDTYVGSDWVEKLGLPETVMVTLPNGTSSEMFVEWDTTALNTREPGYYSVPGELTLPDGVTNSQGLKASITVQVREYTNLVSNPSFEENLTGWFLRGANPSGSRVDTVAADGKYSATLGGSVSGTTIGAADTRNAIITAIPAAGQYYFSSKGTATGADASSVQLQTRLLYKTEQSNGELTASTTVRGSLVTMSNSKFVQSNGILELPENTKWIRLDLYLSAGSTTDYTAMGICFDDVELIPLKYALEAEPSGIKEIKTEILSHVVALNYPDYVGSNWKEQLGLPKTVEVLTDNGTTVSVDVTWDYSGLDFTKYGKYILTGTLDPAFPNPNGITVKQNIYVAKNENVIPNGNFENGMTSWQAAWISKVVEDPLKAGNYVVYATKASMVTSAGGSMVTYQKDVASCLALAEAVAASGAGQYLFSLDAMSAPYDSLTPARDDVNVWIDLRYSTSGSSTGAASAATTAKQLLSTTEWSTVSKVININSGWNWLRTDVKCNAGAAAPGAVYLDNFSLIPLNIVISKDKEPADIESVVDELPTRAVVKDYDKYVSGSWQNALGLPTTVKIRTANGNETSVAVTWDYSNLDLTKTGKYILIGTLDDSTYPNPNNVVLRQTIYIRDYKNLLANPSFEDGVSYWSAGSGSAEKVTSPVLNGGYALKVTLKASLATTTKFIQGLYVSASGEAAQLELANKIQMQGGGQYYFSSSAMFAGANADGYKLRTNLLYKQTLESSSVNTAAPEIALSTSNWSQSAGIVQIPAGIAWARMDLYVVNDSGNLGGQSLYMDNTELVPLNVVIEPYDGEMVQVETIIPDRQIIQNLPDYIGKGYTVADLRFPETVEVSTTVGTTVKVEVKWNYNLLDLTKPGNYTVYGSLDDMKISNPNGLTVAQKVRVVSKTNIFTNGSFESDDDGWSHHTNVTLGGSNPFPVHTGDYSLKFESNRLDSWTLQYLQAFYNGGPTTVGQKVTKTGSGMYAFGGWAQGTASTNDIEVQLRMLYKSLSNGDTSTTVRAPSVKLSTTSFTEMRGTIEMPDDVYWARMDFYLMGTPAQMRLSTLYLDDFYLIPLNVEIPNLTDIINCEQVADIFVHEGSSIAGLKLPETLQVAIKTGQKFEMGVTWDTSTFDPNQIGEQVITGSLNLGNTYKNPKKYTPTARIIVREKGQDLRETIYISNSGSEDNDGLSPASPKKEITKIATYLKQGYNVRLKRGDTWHVPTGSFTFSYFYGTEDVPIVLGAYGEGDEKPIISFAMKIEDTAWTLVDKERNVYAADVSALGVKNGITVHRCFVNNEPYTFKDRITYKALSEGEYCSFDKTLYVRMPEGKAPHNVEATPYGGGHRLLINNVKNFTLEDIHIKGGGGISSLIYIDAPTERVRWLRVDITHVFYYVMMWETDDENFHDRPEVGYCYIDANFNKDEGNVQHGHWATAITEGIVMRDGVESAWIHNNHIRNMSHCFITVESTQRSSDYTTTGVRNCIIEHNLLEGGNARYARAFGMSGGKNASEIEMGRNNIWRYNRAYDMTTSSHLFGVDNLIYSNLFSYVHCEYMEDGTLFDGKNAQPFGFDTLVYSNHGSVGNMLVNNTFYNVSGAIAINDKAHTVYNNIYANNLVVNFTNDAAVYNASGAFYDDTIDLQYVMNNGVYCNEYQITQFVVDKMIYTAQDVNNAVAGYSGNIYADPKFVDADLTNMDKGARMEFVLSNDSPMRYAGLSLYSDVYKSFPMWEKLVEEYYDINGVVYLAESPSIGAYSFCERIGGDLVEVGTIQEILARPGTLSIDQLNLPDAVPAFNDQGIEVMLLTTWKTEGVDFSKPGTVMLEAELRNGPHTELNINGIKAYIKVNIKDKLELLNISTLLSDMTVFYGTSYEDAIKLLPNTLDVMEESGFQEALPVSWICENYNANKAGVYTFKCVLPEDMITNARDFKVDVDIRVLHEIGRGTELLVNADFIDGSSASPWIAGWGTGSFRITTDPELCYPGEPSAAIVTMSGRYGSIQQNVLGQMQLMGNGKYLFKMYMRAYDPGRPIDSSVALLKVFTPNTYSAMTRTKTNIGTDWVEFSSVMDIYDVEQATEIIFHTSTYKSEEDVADTPKSYIISGCSLIYLGKTDAEVEATLDSVGLDWNTIKGENVSEKSVTSDLKLPTNYGTGSKIKWTSSDESVISNTGKVTMGRLEKTVTLTAEITYGNIVTTKKFTVTVPRDPSLPQYSATLTGDQKVNIGDEFKVTISLSALNADKYNAYRYTLSFVNSRVEYVDISDPTATVEVNGGQLIISGIGAERPVTDTITLTFRAKKSGVTDVRLTMLEMDLDPDASLETLPKMTVTNGSATIDIAKDEATTDDGASNGNDNGNMILWIAVGAAAAVLVVGAVVVVLVIFKKKKK